MPSGVYERNTMARDFRGFQRVRQVRRAGGEGSEAIVAVSCRECSCPLERTAKAVKIAAREERGFICHTCHARRMVAVREGRRVARV